MGGEDRLDAIWQGGAMSQFVASQSSVTFSGRTRDMAAVIDPRLKESLALWAKGRRYADLVLRASLAIESLRTAIGSMAIADVSTGGPSGHRFQYRLYGMHMAEATDEYTGRWAEQIEPAAYARVVIAQYEEAVAARVPLLHTVVADDGSGKISYERLTVPLSTGSDVVAQLWVTTAGIGPFGRRLWGRRPYFTG